MTDFPLDLKEFSDLLRVSALTLHCPTPRSVARTGGGEVLAATLGTALWEGECRLSFYRHGRTGGVRALVDLLLDAHASFLITPADYAGPAADPGGRALGAAEIRLGTVESDSRSLTLEGFPPGYRLSPDDLMSLSYGPRKLIAFHRLSSGGKAGADGRIRCQIWPRLRPGWAAGALVELKRPVLRAVMLERVPGTSAGLFHSGLSFRFIQTLR